MRLRTPLRRNPLPVLKLFALAMFSALLLSTTACTVQNKNGGTGQDSVHIHTPLGGMEVHTNSLKPADIGLPLYPGATTTTLQQNSSSADVEMSFASWHMRLRVLNYQSSDPRDRITAFYKNALGRFGSVITCQNNKAIGQPVQTQDGLTCNNDYNYNFNLDANTHKNNDALQSLASVSNTAHLELRAGSPSDQHIVVFDPASGTGTKFVLLNIQVPHKHETD